MSKKRPVRLRVGAGYNDREATFFPPADWDIDVFPHRGASPMTEAGISRAFSRSVGALPIRETARGARTAAILVDDFRRPTPAEPLCLAILDELREAGVPREGISIILGGGAHRTMTQLENKHRLGAVMGQVGHVIPHDAFSTDVSFVGLTSRATPVLVNRVAAEADFSVSVSTAYPHTLTGWGGGAKMVLPGIAHVSTSTFHHTRISGGPWGCAPHLSPARLDIEEAAALMGLTMSVCAVMNGDKTLAGLRVGDPTRAHRSAVKLARKVCETDLAGFSPDLVIANAYPFDGDPTQLSKTTIPGQRCGCPVLVIIDFADPCPWHGVYHGPRAPYMKKPPGVVPERTPELLRDAQVFLYSPQVGKGFAPADSTWYCDHDWDRLMSAMTKRFPGANVAVLPSAPLQMPINVG
ncbi:MAG: DUF2088 domain-containing protein [Lentisphaerae bacterium]|nr:DUF2088 domain-containing protein [Lentisphaerota bacterium]MBT5604701.1 DUF2088 domain-containing protein [Lentisphaerota bacterium]MBT7055114.1 DUF2088 domain-containing protein [Lentisphaerota bacterium]MBT7846286.1 DUF2088 domain-containing protein [Lentisphaerota bacterium]